MVTFLYILFYIILLNRLQDGRCSCPKDIYRWWHLCSFFFLLALQHVKKLKSKKHFHKNLTNYYDGIHFLLLQNLIIKCHIMLQKKKIYKFSVTICDTPAPLFFLNYSTGALADAFRDITILEQKLQSSYWYICFSRLAPSCLSSESLGKQNKRIVISSQI